MTPEELLVYIDGACEYYAKQNGFDNFRKFSFHINPEGKMYIQSWDESTGLPKPSVEQLLAINLSDITKPMAMKRLISHRNILLSESDLYMISDYPMSEEKREECRIYRQALRDLPNNSTPDLDIRMDLIDVTFPTFSL